MYLNSCGDVVGDVVRVGVGVCVGVCVCVGADDVEFESVLPVALARRLT